MPQRAPTGVGALLKEISVVAVSWAIHSAQVVKILRYVCTLR